MKAIEILAESKKIDEAPASTLGNIGRRVGAGVLGALGLNTWAKGLNDKADIGTFSNRYYREFQSYLKAQGKTEEGATFADLKAFLDQNKIPSGRVPTNTDGAVDAAMVNAILNRTATDFLKGTTTSSPSGAPAAQDAQQAPAQDTSRRVAATAGQSQQTAASAQSASTPAGQPFNIPALLQVIPQMNKKDLTKILTATQTALQNPNLASKKAATAPKPTNTNNMTPAQIRATKQAAATNAAQAQMAANPAPAKAPVVTPQDAIAQTRATKQAAAAKMAQDQMAVSAPPGPKVWKNNRNPSAPATSRPTKPKKAVAV